MPTDTKVEVTLCLTDGTKLTRIEDLTNVLTFLEEHQEYVKVVRCKNCIHYDGRYCITPSKAIPRHEDWFCADGEREVEE